MSCLYLQDGNAFRFNGQDNNNGSGLKKKLLLAAILALSAVFAFAQNTSPVLKIKVRTSVEGRSEKGVTVRLYRGNNEEVRIDSTNKRNVSFVLERNQQYTIELSKPGYFTRRLSISTQMPISSEEKPMLRYRISIDLPPSVDLGDDFYMDFPVALISYHPKKDRFEQSRAYAVHIKEKMDQHRARSLVTK